MSGPVHPQEGIVYDPAAPAEDLLANYHDTIAAIRLGGVVAGRFVPRLEEPIDIVMLAALRGRITT